MLRTCSIAQPISDMQDKAKNRHIPDLHVLVTIASAAARIGLSEKAIRRKIESSTWLEGHEFSKAPDGRIYIDVQAVARWQRGLRRY